MQRGRVRTDEAGVDVDGLVAGAVEGAAGGGGCAACRTSGVAEDFQSGRAVGDAVFFELRLPDVFVGGKHDADEVADFVFRGAACGLAAAWVLSLYAVHEAEHGAGINAQKPADEDDDDAAESEASGFADRAAAPV